MTLASGRIPNGHVAVGMAPRDAPVEGPRSGLWSISPVIIGNSRSDVKTKPNTSTLRDESNEAVRPLNAVYATQDGEQLMLAVPVESQAKVLSNLASKCAANPANMQAGGTEMPRRVRGFQPPFSH